MTPGAFLQGVQARAKSSVPVSNARELPVDTCESGISSGENKKKQKKRNYHTAFLLCNVLFLWP